jgi:arsenite methyltransferase
MDDNFDTVNFSSEEAARIVRESYGGVVPQGIGVAESLYDPEEIAWLPDSVTMYALGLGNPVRHADLRPGETVLDVGSGAGIDSFIASKHVGPSGQVIGLDMTAEMIERARANQKKIGLTNVKFREGAMEQMPLEEARVDVIISNGVINLSTDKGQAFREMYRVLKPGGRLVFSDSVVNGQLPRAVLDSEAAFAGWLGGALSERGLIREAKNAGFADAQILTKEPVTKEQLKPYPLFTIEFLDWLFDQFPEKEMPVYLAHFRFAKPGEWSTPQLAMRFLPSVGGLISPVGDEKQPAVRISGLALPV